jgi:hypothetical protein
VRVGVDGSDRFKRIAVFYRHNNLHFVEKVLKENSRGEF